MILNKENRLYWIYKITNPKFSVYIGKTYNLNSRFNHYNKHFTKITQPKLMYSIKKYGWQNHKIEILEVCDFNSVDKREIYWIDNYNSYHYKNENGLNLTPGGDGGKGGEGGGGAPASSTKELYPDGFNLKHKCPKCGFEYD